MQDALKPPRGGIVLLPAGATPETDPHGTPAHAPGAKLDAGKPMPGLVLGDFALALQQVVHVGTFGANKYSPHGWLTVPDGIARYTDAMLRHLLAELAGEAIDPQTGLPHAAHLAWNALARLQLQQLTAPAYQSGSGGSFGGAGAESGWSACPSGASSYESSSSSYASDSYSSSDSGGSCSSSD